MDRKKQRRLRTLLLTRMLSILLGVILLILLALNLFLRVYIVTSADRALDKLVSKVEMQVELRRASEEAGEPLEMDDGYPLGLRGNAFVLSGSGEVLDLLHGEDWAAREIAAMLLDRGGEDGVRQATHLYLEGEMGKYYVSSTEDLLQSDAWMVYYVDVTDSMRFYNAAIQALLLILLGSALLMAASARWLSDMLARKVQRLSDYAHSIGEGQYDTERPAFSTREFDELSAAMGQMAAQIDLSNQNQTAFFQNVSHELRTPLMSIRCYAEGIAYGVMEPRQSSETILDETDRLSGMVEDILYISKIDRRRETVNLRDNDLREILSTCAASQRRLAENEGITFAFRFDEEPVLLYCNGEDLIRLCANLISNAVRYARTRVLLECANGPDTVTLAVSDDGDGIDPEELPHIFERFYKGRGGVHGIGLSIVKSVADLYGGEIRVESRIGSRFEVTFPAAAEQDGEKDESE